MEVAVRGEEVQLSGARARDHHSTASLPISVIVAAALSRSCHLTDQPAVDAARNGDITSAGHGSGRAHAD